jgi:hypothetical protein
LRPVDVNSSIGSVGGPADIIRPFVARKTIGSSFDATCFTNHEPNGVAENQLMNLANITAQDYAPCDAVGSTTGLGRSTPVAAVAPRQGKRERRGCDGLSGLRRACRSLSLCDSPNAAQRLQ